MFDRPDISIFPLGMNGNEVYDIVYLGNIIPNYIYSDIPKMLYDEYVFVFTTLLKSKEDSYCYGDVKIDFMKHELLSCFNNRIKERGNIHTLGKENLKINDFIEIVHEKTEQGKRIIAQLKNQNIVRNYTEVAYTRNFRILMVQENDLDNTPILELGPEFNAKLDWDRSKERLNELRNTLSVLSRLIHKDIRNTDDIQSINKTQAILKKEIEEAKQKQEELFDNYLGITKSLLYVNKRTD